MNGIQKQLREIAKEAYLKDLDTDDETELEPNFLRIIELVKDEKEEGMRFFCDVIWGRIDHPYSLLPFCTRDLRWKEIKEEAMKRYEEKKPNPRLMKWMSDISHAFDDKVWEDADFWPHFRRKELA